MAATGKGKDRRGDYQGTLADASSKPHPGLGGCAGVTGTAAVRRQATAADGPMAGEHRCPRGKEGARPGPGLMRAERGNLARVRRAGAGMRRRGGKPAVKGGGSPG